MTHLRVVARPGAGAGSSIETLLAESGLSEQPVAPEPARDRYLDTQDGRFHDAGYVLLHEAPEGLWQLIDPKGGVLWATGTLDTPPTKGELADEIKRIGRGWALIPHLDVRRNRRVFRFSPAAGAPIAMALEDLTYEDPHADHEARGPRLLVVMGEPSDPAGKESLEFLLTRLPGTGVEPFHPLEEGLRALGLPFPGAPCPPELHLSPQDTLDQAVGKVLRRQAHVMLANRRGLLLDLDPEYLHDVRVATRRAREALRLFRDLLPEPRRQTVREELGRLGKVLGLARDLDVLLLAFRDDLEVTQSQETVGAEIRAALEARRAAAHLAAVHAVEDPLFEKTVESLAALAPSSNQDPPPAGKAAHATMGKALRRLLRRGGKRVEDLGDEDLHRVRIAAKRLRYVTEFFADLEDPEAAKLVPRLTRIQDELGAIQDARVAVATYERVAQVLCADGHPDARVVMTLGALADRRREQGAAHRETFSRRWRKFRLRARRLGFSR